MKHVTISVYRSPWFYKGYDTTNGGISNRLDDIVVFSEDSTLEEIQKWCENTGRQINDVCQLVKRMLWGEKHYYVKPVVRLDGFHGPMGGGNFAYTPDARWAKMLGETVGRPIPIHDRFESQEYN